MNNPYRRKDHPEALPGEVWVSNVSTRAWGEHVFDQIGWKSKRLGTTAFDSLGEPIRDMVPVFAQRSEIEAVGAGG